MAGRAGTVGDRIVFLGHATVLIECEGVRLLTDPLLRQRVAHLRRQAQPVDKARMAGVDAVLISHMHHDHLDPASLRLLGREVPILVPCGAGAWLRRRHFNAVRELAVGETESVGGLAVTAVEAYHDGRRVGGPRSETVGFLLRGRHAVYFAGDTEFFAGMSDLSAGLDVALLPVGGWGRTLGPGHMDPLDAARAAALLQPRIAIPIHWGTFLAIGVGRRHAQLHDPPHLFASETADLAPSVEVRILAPGDETTL
jgi:L-ascorbate metabolism protein UlaG (beta-lactamase superfamily)